MNPFRTLVRVLIATVISLPLAPNLVAGVTPPCGAVHFRVGARFG